MGRVGAPYGVRGMVRVEPVSEDPLALVRHSVWRLRRRGGAWSDYRVNGARAHAGALIAALEGIATREDAAALRGAEVGIDRTELPAPEEGELYWADLEGLDVANREHVTLGCVVGLMDNGAHAILRVRDGVGPERLIPWVPAYIDGVDLEARRIDVDWPADA
jgi:16S rRNA processing protein RimM